MLDNLREKLNGLRLGPLDIENAWWLLPLGLGLWMAPYVHTGWRFSHLVAMLAILTLGLALRRLKPVNLLLHGLWVLAALAAAAGVWHRAGARGLAGTLLFLATLAALGKISDHLLFKNSAVGELSRVCLFLRLPYLLGLGMLCGVPFFCFAGLLLPISWLFVALPLLCLPWGLFLFWRGRREGPRPEQREGLGSAALATLILVPLLLVGIKFATFYKFNYTAHGEMYAPMIWSIAHQDNFPLACQDPKADPGEIAPPLGGLHFEMRGMCSPVRYYGQAGKDLWPSHFSGEILAALWLKWSAIHPHDAFRWTQLITSFCLFAWAALMAAPLAGGLAGGVLWAGALCLRLNEWCYIDLDLCTMAVLGCLWLVGLWDGQRPGRLGRAGMTMVLATILGAVLYTSYPGTLLILLPLLGLVFLWRWWKSDLADENGGRLGGRDALAVLVAGLLLCLLFWNHGPFGRLVHSLGVQDPIFTMQFQDQDKTKPAPPRAAEIARLEGAEALAVESARAVLNFLSGQTKYLMDYYTFRQIPAFLFLAFLAAALGMRYGGEEDRGRKNVLALYAALGLVTLYMATQGYNLGARRNVSLGVLISPALGALFYHLFALAKRGLPPGRSFWALTLGVFLLSLPVILIVTALHINRNYFAAYFFQPLQWVSSFLLAFAAVHCLGRRDKIWIGWPLLGILLWLAMYMDAWNHFSFWNGLRDIKKVSIGLIYRQ